MADSKTVDAAEALKKDVARQVEALKKDVTNFLNKDEQVKTLQNEMADLGAILTKSCFLFEGLFLLSLRGALHADEEPHRDSDGYPVAIPTNF